MSIPITFWVFASLAASFLLSAIVTRLSISHAYRRNLLDQPGQRRSHSQPTARGGGIGIVVVALVVLATEIFLLPREAVADLLGCWSAVALVASVGWIDDHRGLGARWRFLAHCVAALIVLVPILSVGADHDLGAFGAPRSLLAYAVVFACFWLALVWSINLHNFMDGIDGLLAWQGVFVFVALAALMNTVGAEADTWHLCVLAAAVAGFIPFNFPRARIFMGDVGSGAIGLLIGIAVLRQMSLSGIVMLSGVLVCSAFVVDATCNLLSRMLRGKRWYSAHREHLYQWMARAGMSHARVVCWYMGWNLFVVMPFLYAINAAPDCTNGELPLFCSWRWIAGVYALGIALWIYGKRWCLYKVKARDRYATA